MRLAIDSRKRQLETFFRRAGAAQTPEEMQSDLAKFGAVLVCGFVERCVELVVLERLSNRAHPRITQFIKSVFKRGTNYDCEAICQLLERFELKWSRDFRVFMHANDELVQSMNSAYTLRNSIAHGGDANRGLVGVKQLFSAALLVVEALILATST